MRYAVLGAMVCVVLVGCARTPSTVTVVPVEKVPEMRRGWVAPLTAAEVPSTQPVKPARPSPDFYAEDEPFNEVLARFTLITFKVNEAALAAAGVKMDTPVWALVEKATVRKALTSVLKSVEMRTPGKPRLVFEQIGTRILLITTREDLWANHVYTREYDIRDLLVDETDEILPIPDRPEERGKAQQERSEALSRLLQETVDPDSWTGRGSKCSVKCAKGVLTCTQTNANLAQLEDLLSQLRESRFRGLDAPIVGYTDQVLPPKPKPTTRRAPVTRPSR